MTSKKCKDITVFFPPCQRFTGLPPHRENGEYREFGCCLKVLKTLHRGFTSNTGKTSVQHSLRTSTLCHNSWEGDGVSLTFVTESKNYLNPKFPHFREGETWSVEGCWPQFCSWVHLNSRGSQFNPHRGNILLQDIILFSHSKASDPNIANFVGW